jgi:hypothetical protein
MARIHIATEYQSKRVTRSDGAELRAAIEKHWADAEPLVLDFSGVRIASVSFFDESLGRLALLHPVEELTTRVKVENIDPADRRLLDDIVRSRLQERKAADSAHIGR